MNRADIPARTLHIGASLDSGQCFRWHRAADGDWYGVIAESAVRLRPALDHFMWQTYPTPDRWDLLERYFALDVDLDALYADWEGREPRIGPTLRRFAGLRILRQDPAEALFGFLCATCNTITKIRRSVNALARRAGEPICEIDGTVFHAFPMAERIAAISERDLRADLWGYRAPRLIEAARHVVMQGPGWFERLRSTPYEGAYAELVQIAGIGAKVADCICLFGFSHDQAAPIDTHTRQIAVRLWRPDLTTRSLTPTVYRALADLYRDRFGPYAGWAQQYLFFAELAHSEEMAHAIEDRFECTSITP